MRQFHKEVIFNDEVKTRVKKGIDILADAVKSTLGPNGKNVIIHHNKQRITTKDGVTVAKMIELEDDFENLGAELLAEAAISTNTVSGDGTTTSVVLAQALIDEGLKVIDSGIKTYDFINDVKTQTMKIVDNLNKSSKKITTESEKKEIASISANSKEIGEMVGHLYHKIGNDGTVVVEDSDKIETTDEIIDGFRFKQGYVSRHFITHLKRETCEITNPYILITDLELKNFFDLTHVINKLLEETEDHDIVIIGDKISGNVVTDLIINKAKGILNPVAIEKPYFGLRGDKKEYMEDLALITGGRFIDKDKNELLKELKLEDLGRAEKIIVKKDQTIIINGGGSKKKVKQELDNLLKKDQTKKDVKQRLSRLRDKVGIIKAGASTKTELQEKKFRIEDSIEATKAALEEGIVAGGGLALINASKDVSGVMKKVCQQPFIQILKNIDKPSKDIINKVGGDTGYNATTEKIVNVFEEGIIDPVKVVKTALLNAVSVATEFLKTETVVIHIDGPKEEPTEHTLM